MTEKVDRIDTIDVMHIIAYQLGERFFWNKYLRSASTLFIPHYCKELSDE